MVVVEFVFWISVFILYYIYDGYLRLLILMDHLFSSAESNVGNRDKLPTVTVLVTVFNEERSIVQKIDNIRACDYPPELLQIIIASDGSIDNTDDLVRNLPYDNLLLFRPENRVGKTDTQNQAMEKVSSEIVIFSDADTYFDKHFLLNITAPFRDDQVGGVDGHLLFTIDPQSAVSQSQGFYWDYELKIRERESRLGLLAVTSGACLAIRRKLFLKMEAEYGEDCIIPLDIVAQGYKIIHASEALAYDQMEYAPQKEFANRVRMTIRNLQGTFSRKHLLNPVTFLKFSFSLWSHKILRWFSPVFLLLVTASAFLLSMSSFFYQIVLFGLICFYGAAGIGKMTEMYQLQVPFVRTVYSFVLANYGFFIGILRAFKNEKITTYRDDN